MKIPQDINSVFKNTRVAVLAESQNKQCPQEWDMTTGSFSFVQGGTNSIISNSNHDYTNDSDNTKEKKPADTNISTPSSLYPL